jgi:hypothetical protein
LSNHFSSRCRSLKVPVRPSSGEAVDRTVQNWGPEKCLRTSRGRPPRRRSFCWLCCNQDEVGELQELHRDGRMSASTGARTRGTELR